MLKFYILLALSAALFLGCGSYDEVHSFYAEECGNGYYDTERQFCRDSEIYDKCGGNIYDPLNQKCENNSLFSKCGNSYYNTTTQFCQNTRIYDKCGGDVYDPLNQKCENSIVFSKCGDEWYNPFSEFCTGDGNIIGSKGEFVDSRDGKAYKYVIIGTQTWMAENLRYETLNTKCYNDNPDNCIIFGMLYDWNTAKTICPSGWHLPSDEEWITLKDYVDSDAAKLKANSSTWKLNKGTDDFGFTALPGGFYRWDYGFKFNGECAGFWSATKGSMSGSAHMRYLNEYSFGLDGFYIDNSWVNVRCLKSVP